jgi:hypothetical protein
MPLRSDDRRNFKQAVKPLWANSDRRGAMSMGLLRPDWCSRRQRESFSLSAELPRSDSTHVVKFQSGSTHGA